MHRYGSIEVFYDYSCSDALEIISAGVEQQQMPVKIVKQIISELQEQMLLIQKRLIDTGVMKNPIFTNEQHKEPTYEEADEIADRILKRRKKNGNR